MSKSRCSSNTIPNVQVDYLYALLAWERFERASTFTDLLG
jgi:hypothetical protein